MQRYQLVLVWLVVRGLGCNRSGLVSNTWCVARSRHDLCSHSDDCGSCFDSIQATTFRLMNEVEPAQLSNRVVAVTDEELLLVDMQHVRWCRCYQIGIWCASPDICVLLCQNRVEYGWVECMRKFVALSKKKRVCETLHAVSNLLFRRQMRHYCLVWSIQWLPSQEWGPRMRRYMIAIRNSL